MSGDGKRGGAQCVSARAHPRLYKSRLAIRPLMALPDERFYHNSPLGAFPGYLPCKKALHYYFDWRFICALLVSYVRVSTRRPGHQGAGGSVEDRRPRAGLLREDLSWMRDLPEVHRLLEQLRKGDVLVVWKLDRSCALLRDLLTTTSGSLRSAPTPYRTASTNICATSGAS